MGSKFSKKSRKPPRIKDLDVLASETPFTVSEVEALYELYKKLSSSVVNDGFIQKEELQLALFKSNTKQNLFTDSVFSMHSDYMILRRTGYIEHEELKEMVLALLTESNMTLSDDVIETIVDKKRIPKVMEGSTKKSESVCRKESHVAEERDSPVFDGHNSSISQLCDEHQSRRFRLGSLSMLDLQ